MKRSGHEQKKLLGFTLIELLIVVSIIGVISSLVIVNLSKANKKSRDTRRKKDLGEIRTALEFYFDDRLGYPSQAKADAAGIGDGILSPYYIKNLPTDPKPNTHTYYYTGSASAFTLEATLEQGGIYTVYSSN